MSTSLLGRIGPSEHTSSMCVFHHPATLSRTWHIYKTLFGSLPLSSTVICPLNVWEERSAAGWQLERSSLLGLVIFRVANHFLDHQRSNNINSADSRVSIYGACQISNHHLIVILLLGIDRLENHTCICFLLVGCKTVNHPL